MSEYILIRVKRPEDSEDVIPEILAEDFIATAQYGQWEWEAWDEEKIYQVHWISMPRMWEDADQGLFEKIDPRHSRIVYAAPTESKEETGS